MSRMLLVVFAVALALMAFGVWGTQTDAGRRRFDEMAGMIPMGALWLGALLGVVALVWGAIAASRGQG